MYITRTAGEAMEDTCVVTKIKRRKSIMFWGSFISSNKGPIYLWDPDEGTINAVRYCRTIVSRVE